MSAFSCIMCLCREGTCLIFSSPVVCTALYVSVVCSFRVCPLAAAVAVPRIRDCGVQPGWRGGRWWKTTSSPLWLLHIRYKPKALNNCHFLPVFGSYICVKALDKRWLYTQTPSEEAFSLNKIDFKSLSISWNLTHIPGIRVVEIFLVPQK